jgi:hypothetical protein
MGREGMGWNGYLRFSSKPSQMSKSQELRLSAFTESTTLIEEQITSSSSPSPMNPINTNQQQLAGQEQGQKIQQNRPIISACPLSTENGRKGFSLKVN